MHGCICTHCGIPYGSATWVEPFLCGRCRQYKADPIRLPLIQFWDATWFEVPPPERFELAS
jgi:hypothetical protein